MELSSLVERAWRPLRCGTIANTVMSEWNCRAWQKEHVDRKGRHYYRRKRVKDAVW